MSDSFMWLDTKYGVTKELLKIFKFYKYPYVVFTRSDLVAHDDYMVELDKNLCSIQFSIAGNNNRFIRKIEPGAPSYTRRLKALEKLSKHDFWTTVRINPLFAKYPDGYFTDPESISKRFGSTNNVPVMPFYDDQFVAEVADTGTPSILAGFVRLSSQSIKGLTQATGIDVSSFFKPELYQQRGHKRYSDLEIAYYYRWFHQECRKHEVRFNTCYIGNGLKDYYQYQDMWDNKQDCCDIVGNIDSFNTTSQNVDWAIREKHAPRKDEANASREAEADMHWIQGGKSKNPRLPDRNLTL